MYLKSSLVKSVYPTAYRDATYDSQADNTNEYNVTNTVKRIGGRNYVVFYDTSISGANIALKVSIGGYSFEIAGDGLSDLRNEIGANGLFLYIKLSSDTNYTTRQLIPADGSGSTVVDLDGVINENDNTKYFYGLGYGSSVPAGISESLVLKLFDADGNVPSSSYGVLTTDQIVDKTGDTNEKLLSERITTAELAVNGNANITGKVSITNNTQSTSTGTGALKVSGGVGIVKNATIGGDASVGGNLSVTGTAGITGNTSVGGNLTVTGVTTLNGGESVTGNVYIKGSGSQPRLVLINKDNTNSVIVETAVAEVNRTIILPDKSGTVKLSDDVTGGPSATSTVASSGHTHSVNTTASATTDNINAYTGLTKKYFHPSFTGTQGTTSKNSGNAVAAVTSVTSDSGTFVTGISGSGTADAVTGITFTTGSCAPNNHTHSVTASGSVTLTSVSKTGDTEPAGTKYIEGVSNGGTADVATSLNVSSTSKGAAAHTHTHTYDKTTGVSITNGTNIGQISWNSTDAIMTITPVTISASPTYTSTASGTDSGNGIDVVHSVSIQNTAKAITALDTKYLSASFTGTAVTSGANSGTAVSAYTSNSTTTGTFIKSTGLTTGTALTGVSTSTSNCAPNEHTHTITPSGSVSLGQNTTADNGVEHITGGTTTSVSKSTHTHSISTTSGTPSGTTDVASSGHTHTL